MPTESAAIIDPCDITSYLSRLRPYHTTFPAQKTIGVLKPLHISAKDAAEDVRRLPSLFVFFVFFVAEIGTGGLSVRENCGYGSAKRNLPANSTLPTKSPPCLTFRG